MSVLYIQSSLYAPVCDDIQSSMYVPVCHDIQSSLYVMLLQLTWIRGSAHGEGSTGKSRGLIPQVLGANVRSSMLTTGHVEVSHGG